MYAQVAVPLPIRKMFTYAIPPGIQTEAAVGKRVKVPFSGRLLTGYIVELSDIKPPRPVKEVKTFPDSFPLFDEDMLAITRWVADYYSCSWGESLKAASPPEMKRVKKDVEDIQPEKIVRTSPFIPTSEQKEALKVVGKCMEEKGGTVLLHGVTGSGKTEVYLQSIARLLETGRQAIVLIPEIALTPQTWERFQHRFGNRIVLWHSRLSAGERYREWIKVRDGKVDIVIGARSAIFAPLKKLGLIIIDEEHENSYKQTDNPKYHAREVALKRAEMMEAVVVLGTATPSMESYFQAQKKKYRLAVLSSRVDHKVMPAVEIVDMRDEITVRGNRSIFSRVLQQAIKEKLENHEQIILFLNRRGFSPFILCRECGEVISCQHCHISLTYHTKTDKLHCHYCGYQEAKPDSCPKCRNKKVGYLGIGTQKVEREISKLFPQAILVRMDSDTTTKKGSHAKILGSFREQKFNILIGTQMIAKGLDFPRVTLVGVISADTSLNLADFRASERTFQLLTQVAGRTGRGDTDGKVIIQTYNPQHYSVQAASRHDYESFYRQEITYRQELNYPPFTCLINLTLRSPDQDFLIKTATKLSEILVSKTGKNLEVLGPVQASIPRLSNWWRWQILLKGNDIHTMRKTVEESMASMKELSSGKLKIQIDIDPINML